VTTTAVYVTKRENAIVNRLNKTKDERVVDHEQERIDRIKKENAIKRAAAAEKVIKQLEKDDPNLNADIYVNFRKSKMLNWQKPEKRKRRRGHTTPYSMWKKTRAYHGRLVESWRKISCNNFEGTLADQNTNLYYLFFLLYSKIGKLKDC
jgi:hypothetical protein